MDEARDRFERLAWPRLEKLEKAAEILVNCSNPSTYEYTDEEAVEIVLRAQEAAEAVTRAFGDPVDDEPQEDVEPMPAPAGRARHDVGLIEQVEGLVRAEGDQDRILHILAMLRVNAEMNQ